MNKCVAITQVGTQCKRNKLRGLERCGMHHATFEENGPNRNELIELDYVNNREIREIQAVYIQRRTDINRDAGNLQQIIRTINLEEDTELATTRLRQNTHKNAVVNRQQEEILRTGINPDARADLIRERRRLEREQQWLDRQAIMIAEQNEWGRLGIVAAVVVNQNVQVGAELRNLAADRQNVHTTLVVQKTKEYVNAICRIQVPPEYRWNMNECSKTIGEIINECKLTPRGAWQMAAKYCSDENIYEMGGGIYGKVLDSVWQYVKTSPSKDDLCKIIRQEMEDNVGMCAQGNLSRLCNILSGYLEGLGSHESVAERLGRLLPPLGAIEDRVERLGAVKRVLEENNVPHEEWLTWAEPLFEESLEILIEESLAKLTVN